LVKHIFPVLRVNKRFASAELREEPEFESFVRRSVWFVDAGDDGPVVTSADVSPVATSPFDLTQDPEGVR
jgi:hypothetical protein